MYLKSSRYGSEFLERDELMGSEFLERDELFGIIKWVGRLGVTTQTLKSSTWDHRQAAEIHG